MLKPNQKVYVISKKGEVKEAEFVKSSFVCRIKNGRENTYYRVFESKNDALEALANNGGKRIYGKENLAGVNLFADVLGEIQLLNLKIEVLSKQKANKPWYCGIFHALGKKED